MANSQNGYPALQANSSKLHKWVIPGADRYFLLRNGSAGFLLAHLALWYHEKIQRLNLKGDPWDEWGYAYRAIRDAHDLSNHASGTAEDLNSSRYPLGRHVIKHWRKLRIHAHLRLYKRAVRWGGDYNSRLDEMHFEINKPLPFVERVARRLMKTRRGKRILEANPSQKKVILS